MQRKAIEPATVIIDSESHSQRTLIKTLDSSSEPRDSVALGPLIMLYVIPVAMSSRVWEMFGPARYALFQKYQDALIRCKELNAQGNLTQADKDEMMKLRRDWEAATKLAKL